MRVPRMAVSISRTITENSLTRVVIVVETDRITSGSIKVVNSTSKMLIPSMPRW